MGFIGIMGHILGLFWDNGKQNGKYYLGFTSRSLGLGFRFLFWHKVWVYRSLCGGDLSSAKLTHHGTKAKYPLQAQQVSLSIYVKIAQAFQRASVQISCSNGMYEFCYHYLLAECYPERDA